VNAEPTAIMMLGKTSEPGAAAAGRQCVGVLARCLRSSGHGTQTLGRRCGADGGDMSEPRPPPLHPGGWLSYGDASPTTPVARKGYVPLSPRWRRKS